jgi:hypothetical protein
MPHNSKAGHKGFGRVSRVRYFAYILPASHTPSHVRNGAGSVASYVENEKVTIGNHKVKKAQVDSSC